MADNRFCRFCGTSIPAESQFCLRRRASLTAEKEHVYVVRKATQPRAAEGVPHWTKPEWLSLAWFLIMLLVAYSASSNIITLDTFASHVVADVAVLSLFVMFFVFVGTEVYLNRQKTA